jgi:hypothetical protein
MAIVGEGLMRLSDWARKPGGKDDMIGSGDWKGRADLATAPFPRKDPRNGGENQQ